MSEPTNIIVSVSEANLRHTIDDKITPMTGSAWWVLRGMPARPLVGGMIYFKRGPNIIAEAQVVAVRKAGSTNASGFETRVVWNREDAREIEPQSSPKRLGQGFTYCDRLEDYVRITGIACIPQ